MVRLFVEFLTLDLKFLAWMKSFNKEESFAVSPQSFWTIFISHNDLSAWWKFSSIQVVSTFDREKKSNFGWNEISCSENTNNFSCFFFFFLRRTQNWKRSTIETKNEFKIFWTSWGDSKFELARHATSCRRSPHATQRATPTSSATSAKANSKKRRRKKRTD